MNDRLRKVIVRVNAVIGIIGMAGFSFMLLRFRSPTALPFILFMLVPLGVSAVWLVTGRFTLDLVPLVRRLKGWKAALFVAVAALLALYTWVFLWWLLKRVR